MDRILLRESRFETWYRAIFYACLLTSMALTVYWAFKGNMYQCLHAICSLLFPLGLHLVYRLLRLNRAYQLEAILLLFIYISYTLGVAARWYHIIAYYDKIMHALSGTLTMILALPMFYLFKPEKEPKRTDLALALTFCLAVTLGVAALWEVSEYFINLVTGIDLQNTQATGVADSMQDMIVCTLGALLVVPSLLRYYRKGKTGFIMGAVLAFANRNPGMYAPRKSA